MPSHETYHPIIKFPDESPVFDFTTQADRERSNRGGWGIGRYNERRPGMYLFHDGRFIHMGIDLFAPAHTTVYAFADGEVYMTANNNNPQDYGPTVITKHIVGDKELYVLHGHLSEGTLRHVQVGDGVTQGMHIGWVGKREENGGWSPHVHVQLTTEAPEVCDMPGVVSDEQLEAALQLYPDPRLILGPIY